MNITNTTGFRLCTDWEYNIVQNINPMLKNIHMDGVVSGASIAIIACAFIGMFIYLIYMWRKDNKEGD